MRIEIDLPPLMKNKLASHISHHDPRARGPILHILGENPDDPNDREYLTLGFEKKTDYFAGGKTDEYWICRPEYDKDRARVVEWETRLREWQR